MRIGLDVGGTHTDAVILDGRDILARHKATTSADITSGIVEAFTTVLDVAGAQPSAIDAVMLGTTQFTNAVVERRGLSPVATVRVALPSGECLPPMVDWPDDLSAALGRHVYMLQGGSEFDGRDLAPLDEEEIDRVSADIRSKGLKAVAVSAVFSPIRPDVEHAVAERMAAALPEARIVCSHELGRLGLLERENAAILNACLLEAAERVVSGFEELLTRLDITAPFFVSQNDGTVMQATTVRRYPVLTFSSGPTNSMRGAAFLSGIKDAIVADVGGTTTDIGMLINGFPRESSWTVEIGGVRSNYRMPDILAIGLGGGSLVSADGTAVGPRSVGHELVRRGRCFGGDTLTATDIAVAAGLATIGAPVDLDGAVVKTAQATMHAMATDAVDRIKTSADPLPLIAVGGGQFLIGDGIPGISRIVRPPHADVANAVGAALAQVSGEVEHLYRPGRDSRERAIAAATEQATGKAIAAGARPQSVDVVAVDEIPIPYMAQETVRLHARVVGDLDLPADARP
ncbi:MAG: hydantoinase/oxoprolinase family protein [Sphingomonadales bacterium]|nr:hydantoinase/oxoprolinase family protein [Sphingomonadales bacterium]